MANEPKPIAAFALSVFAGLVTIIAGFIASSMPSLWLFLDATNASNATLIQIWGTIAGLLIIVGSWLLYNNAAQRKVGSIVALVFSLISMNILTLVLGLIGGFLGFTFKGTSTSKPSSSGRSSNPP